nr:GNAT family N-acetyltransferase [uncultured Psychroserpens sp.]
MIQIIRNKKEWDSFLDSIVNYDFYHTYDYHELSIKDDEESLLLVYTENDIIIGLPFILRQIPNTNYKDITSVYGYAGPISKNIPENFDNQKFTQVLSACLHDLNVVSVFSRLNPFVEKQHQVLKNIGKTKHVGSIVNIDLTKPLDLQRQGYQRRIKTQINKSRRLCNVRKATSKEDLLEFIKIYYENMDRVEARSSYYFKQDYFFKFLESKTLQTDLLLATLDGTDQIIAGAMFIKTNNIVQYHISGCLEEHLDIASVKLLIDEMRILATQEGYKYFNLGGGYGGQNDSLLRFKLSFSKQLVDFHVWNYVVNENLYAELTTSKKEKHSDYFPEYRDPN